MTTVKKRKATVTKFAERREVNITKDMVKKMSREDLKSNLRLYGKRAQSRLKQLQKSLPRLRKSGLDGMAEMILDRFTGFNTKAKGLSLAALRAKLFRTIDILTSSMSTSTGITELEQKRFDTFKQTHKGLSKISIDKYREYVKIMGKVQAAHEGLKYDSDTDVYAAIQVEDKKRDIDDFLSEDDMEKFQDEEGYWETVNEVFGFDKL